jgi:hypothetical protein
MSNLKPVAIWEKDSRIVLGIDVGATRTAVAYSYLYKGWFTRDVMPLFAESVPRWCGMCSLCGGVARTENADAGWQDSDSNILRQ